MDQAAQVWQQRAALRDALRSFFATHAYVEVDTPLAVPCPGTEVHLQYFKTHWRDYRSESFPLWLRSSPELHMKQVLAQGLPRIYQLGPCFRNGGEFSPWHHPEFAMLEWYRSAISFEDYIKETLDLLAHCESTLRTALPGTPIKGLPKDFEWMTVSQAFARFAGVSLRDGDSELARQAKDKGVVSVNRDDDFETAFFKILLEKVEPALTSLAGVILYDYPPSQAALARVEGGVAKRFEVYLYGVELCNGFYELLDASENKQRISEANAMRRQLGHEVTPEDEGFYAALRSGIPACCGNALGFDRLLALLLGHDSLAPILPFRHQAPYPTE